MVFFYIKTELDVIDSHLLGVHVELLSAHGHLFIPLHAFPKNKNTTV